MNFQRKMFLYDEAERLVNKANRSGIGGLSFLAAQCEAINSHEPIIIYEFATKVRGANIDKLQTAMFAYGDAEHILKFALNVDGADIELLEGAVIDSGDSYYMFAFAQMVPGANKLRIKRELLRLRDIDRIKEHLAIEGKVPVEDFERFLDYNL